MDGDRFDTLVRDLGLFSRRRILGRAPLLAVGALVAVGDAAARKQKKKRNKKNRCPSYAPKVCGRDCCSESFKCCHDREARGGKSCVLDDYHCCPASYGGACPSGDTCCPPRKGETGPHCINSALGYHCCPQNSGGYCDYDEACCPSEFTNSNNYGCCDLGERCCNFDSDCDTWAGEECFLGCCWSF